MTIAVSAEPRFKEIEITEDAIVATLVDGRTVSVPLAWSWRLSEASVRQRQNFEIFGDGLGAHWPEIDEDLSAKGMLSGVPARRTERRALAS